MRTILRAADEALAFPFTGLARPWRKARERGGVAAPERSDGNVDVAAEERREQQEEGRARTHAEPHIRVTQHPDLHEDQQKSEGAGEQRKERQRYRQILGVAEVHMQHDELIRQSDAAKAMPKRLLAIGTAIDSGVTVFFWAAGAVILGLFVLSLGAR